MLNRLWTRMTSINVPLVAAALFASAILHILATLAVPRLTPTSAYGRLASALPVNTMHLLPEVAPGSQPLPFLSSDARYAICHFDTSNGPISLSAALPEPGWMLALYSPQGEAFFTSVGTPVRPTEVSLMIVPGDDVARRGTRPTGLTTGFGGRPSSAMAVTRDSMLTIPANEGIAVVRAPDRGEAYRNRILAELGRASCKPSRDRSASKAPPDPMESDRPL